MSLLAYCFSQIFFCVGQYSLLSAITLQMFVLVCRFSIFAFIDADSMGAIAFPYLMMFFLVPSVDVTICPTYIMFS